MNNASRPSFRAGWWQVETDRRVLHHDGACVRGSGRQRPQQPERPRVVNVVCPDRTPSFPTHTLRDQVLFCTFHHHRTIPSPPLLRRRLLPFPKLFLASSHLPACLAPSLRAAMRARHSHSQLATHTLRKQRERSSHTTNEPFELSSAPLSRSAWTASSLTPDAARHSAGATRSRATSRSSRTSRTGRSRTVMSRAS